MDIEPNSDKVTLRDWLAAHCLSEVCSNKKNVHEWQPEVARLAYRLADEMLIARKIPTDELWPTEDLSKCVS